MKFAKEQRVTVPGLTAQGVVVDATENIIGFPVYTLRWLDPAGETHTGSCGEGDLESAQPEVLNLVVGTKPLTLIVPKPAAAIFKNKRKPAQKRKR